VEAFLDDETFSASVRAEGNDGVLRVDRLSDVPEHVALLLGDVIHNARCALDHVVWDLASTGGGTAGRPPSDGDARAIAFPVTSSAHKFSKPAARLGRYLDVTVVKRVERLQPWAWAARAWPEPDAPTPEQFETFCSLAPLKRLSDLDNADKRRLSITVWYPGTVKFGPDRSGLERATDDSVLMGGPDLEEFIKTDEFRSLAAQIEEQDAAPETVDFYFMHGLLSEGTEIGRYMRNDRGPVSDYLTTGATSLRIVVEEDGLTGMFIGVPAMLDVVGELIDEVEKSCLLLERHW
jgi:hypothetical protein